MLRRGDTWREHKVCRSAATLWRVSRILEWYGEDFVASFAPDAAGKPDRLERVARAVVARFGPPAAVELARKPSTRIKFLDYDWSLNDVR